MLIYTYLAPERPEKPEKDLYTPPLNLSIGVHPYSSVAYGTESS